MKLSPEFVRECVEEKLDAAIKYGIRRAYKHSDKEGPSDDQIEQVCDSVTSALFEMFDFEEDIEDA